MRLVALEGEEYPAPRRPADDGRGGRAGGADGARRRVGGGTDWLGDRFGGDSHQGSGDTDLRPANRVTYRVPGTLGRTGNGARLDRGAAAEGRAATARFRERATAFEKNAEVGPERLPDRLPDRRSERWPERRPVRLTRRGRLVVLALALSVGALVGFLGAAPGQAADPPKPAVTAVVQPGDTLWSFAERNLPGWQPKAGVDELKRLNDLEGYVIHPGQRLALPAHR